MSRLVARRLLEAVLALLAMAIVMFFLLHLDHASPARAMLGKEWTPQKGAALTAALGLDRPVPVQFLLWVKSLFSVGGLGEVLRYQLPATMEILVLGSAVGYAITVLLARLQTRYAGSVLDYALTLVLGFLGAVPGFALGLCLMFLFAIHWVLLPAASLAPPDSGPSVWAFYHILPVLSLSLTVVGPWSRQLRASMSEESAEQYVRTARAKGASEGRIIRRHIFKNALLPFITLVGLSMPTMINTVIALDLIFRFQGVGAALLGSLLALFFARATTAALVLAFLTVLGSVAADVAYGLIDPRIQYQ